MENQQTRKKSGSGLKVTAIIIGVVDVLLIVVLVLCFLLIKPAGGEALEPRQPEAFEANADTYWDSKMELELPSQAAVNFEAALPEPPTPPADPNAGPYAGFIFPDSNTVALTDEMILAAIVDQPTCQRAINEIYARHGFLFTKQENLDYFNTYEWYATMEKVEDMEAVLGQFSEIEKSNVEKLQAFQNAQGWTQEG